MGRRGAAAAASTAGGLGCSGGGARRCCPGGGRPCRLRVRVPRPQRGESSSTSSITHRLCTLPPPVPNDGRPVKAKDDDRRPGQVGRQPGRVLFEEARRVVREQTGNSGLGAPA